MTLLLVLLLLAASHADSAIVRMADGSRLEASAIAVDAQSGVSLSVPGRGVVTGPLGDLIAIEFPVRPAPDSSAARAVVTLHDGSRLVGTIRGGDEDLLQLELARGGTLAIPVDVVRAVFVGPRSALLDVARFADAAQGDSLHRRPEVGGDFTRGTLAAFAADGVRFEYSLGTQVFPWDEIEALVLARQVDLGEPPAPVVDADFRGDGTLRGTLLRLTDKELVLQPTGFAAPIALPREELQSVRFFGDQHRWLSDLTPARVEQVPYLGPPEQFLFPYRADRGVTGAPLLIKGRRYPKGFGCHSRTTLEFALDGRYARFDAEVGVSDEVAALLDHGSIEFRLLVDGQEKWKSAPLHGGEPAVRVGPIALTGAKKLELVTDFGEGEDVADRGIWGAPLLLR